MSRIVRVLRVIEYEGTEKWVKATLEKSIKGEVTLGENCVIRAAVIGDVQEVLKQGAGDAEGDEAGRWGKDWYRERPAPNGGD